jgi:RNA methyltransferase, TrmH family
VWIFPVEALQGGLPMREEITSLQNPKMKKAVKLIDRKARNETGLFLIEGYRELKRASDSGSMIQTLFICPSLFLGVNEQALIDQVRAAGAEVIVCSKQVFQKLSYRDRSDGLIAVAVQMQRYLRDLVALLASKKDPFLIIAEAIEKPGNLGTILRSADAAGVDGVIVCDRCTDIYNPNVVRASVGALFTIPVVEASSAETLLWLQQRKIRVVAATPSAKEEFTDAELTGGVAIVVGTEQLGLTELWMKASDIQVRIPMHGVADSLNVATATTLLLYEVVRQRKSYKDMHLWK